VQEGDVFYFKNGEETRGTPEDHRAAVRINKAIYGARGRYVDVTNRIRELAAGRRAFTVSTKTFGVDPTPGRQKLLKISYRRGKTTRTQQYADGDSVRLK